MSKAMSVTETLIENKIFVIRSQKVMLDFDLAEMYGVETKVLKQAVKRNIERFPEDFMFELNAEEVVNLSRSQFVTLKRGQNIKYPPYAFTEHGVLMLSSVLRSERAVQVNIQIMRVYSKMKELLLMNKDILTKLEKLEMRSDKHDKEIKLIFDSIKRLIAQPIERTQRIGFKKNW
jgi:phage regulator Rha-like protein